MAAFTHTKLLYDVNEAMELLNLSRSTLFEEIRAGRLQAVKRGRSRLVPAEAADEYAALLKREADAA